MTVEEPYDVQPFQEGYSCLTSTLLCRHYPNLDESGMRLIFERKTSLVENVRIGKKGNTQLDTPKISHCIYRSYIDTVQDIADDAVQKKGQTIRTGFSLSRSV